jgi:hypothetical protein
VYIEPEECLSDYVIETSVSYDVYDEVTLTVEMKRDIDRL